MTSEPPQNEIDSSTPTRLQNTTNDVVSCAYVRISVRHDVAVPRPTSFVRARSRPGDDETLTRICAPSSASSWGVERCQKSSHTASPTPDAQPRRHRPQHVARGEEPALVEQAVGRQVDLAVDVPELAVLEQRGRDEQPVVGGLLDERHDGRQPARRGGQRGEAGVVEAHRDLGREVLEQVAGQAQLREHDEAGPGLARLGEELVVAREVGVELPETRRDLGEGDPERLHAASIAAAAAPDPPTAGACAFRSVTAHVPPVLGLDGTRRVAPRRPCGQARPIDGPSGCGRRTQRRSWELCSDHRGGRVRRSSPSRRSSSRRVQARPPTASPAASAAAAGDERPRNDRSRSAAPYAGDGLPGDRRGPLRPGRGPDATHAAYAGEFKKITALDANTVEFQLCNPGRRVPVEDRVQRVRHRRLRLPGGPRRRQVAARRSRTAPGPTSSRSGARATGSCSTANDAYWGDKAQTPSLEFRWSDEAAQRWLELQSGSVDGIDNPGTDDIATIKADSSVTFYPREGLNTFYLGFNNTIKPWTNVKIRQAIAMGIDRQRIVDNFYPEGSEVATHFTPCAIPFGCDG